MLDPVRTHLALGFDTSIDNLQDALQELSWTFEHSWLPWDNKIRSEPEGFREREIDASWQAGRQETPGILFFRGQDKTSPQAPPASPLIVLIVSDTPTSGVSPKQFKNAIGIWNNLAKATQQRPLNILGPTFSGSLSSLQHLLVDKPPAQVGFIHIASGTVTSNTRLKEMNDALNGKFTPKGRKTLR